MRKYYIDKKLSKKISNKIDKKFKYELKIIYFAQYK